MDLHALTLKHGNKVIAGVLGTTVRNLIDLRRGRTPLLIDDLFALDRAFDGFDMLGTIERIGQRRIDNGRSNVVERTAITVDDLYLLHTRWGEAAGIPGWVRAIGEVRQVAGRSRGSP